MSSRTPATRRSTRLASNEATPAEADTFAEPVSGRTRRTTATPAASAARSIGTNRLGRGRTGATIAAGVAAAPLPPVQATNSHAYGASGRASLADPSRLRTSNASPNLALDKARDQALARQQDAVQSRTPVAAKPPAIPEESEVEVQPNDQTPLRAANQRSSLAPSSRRSSTPPDGLYGRSIIDTSRSFGLRHEAGIVPPHGFHFARPTRTELVRRWLSDKYVAFRDWSDGHFPKPGTLVLVGLLFAYLFTLMLGIDMPQPDGTSLEKARESLYKSMSNVARVTGAHLEGLKQEAKLAHLDKQLTDQRNRYEDLSGRYNDVNVELERLKSMLPDLTVVRRKQEGDGYELLDHFWDALEAKAAGEHGRGNKMPWDKWFNRNQEMVAEVQKSMTSEDYNAIMAWGLKHYSLLTKDEVLRILQEHYQEYDAKMSTKYDQKLSHVHDKTIESATERYLSQHFKSHKYKLIEGAWAQKTIENARLSLERPNFMSAKLGANIDPYLTSPTASKPYKSWQAWIYGSWFAASPPSNPPVEALRGWEEAGDCWCSAQSDSGGQSDADEAAGTGKAQLGIYLAQAMYPTHLVIEHVPKAGTLAPGSAPRDVELWARVQPETVREALALQLGVASWGGDEGGRCAERGSTLPEDYVCVGKMRYDLDGWNHVQMSALEIDFKGLEIPIHKVVVRVQNTWGARRVCLYRVRLLGEPA